MRRRAGTRRAMWTGPARRAARHRMAGPAGEVESLAQRHEIRKEAIRAEHAFGQLSKPGEARVHEIPLAVPRDEQPAAERAFAGIASGEDRSEALVPLVREVEPALLDPAVEIRRRDAIRRRQHR